MMAFTERAASLQKVRKILRKSFGKPSIPESDSVARQILWFVLLERSSFDQVEKALEQIDEVFVDLNELRVSLPREIAASIPSIADAESKAHRVTRVFNALFLLKNTMDWSFVRTMGVRELRQFFEKLDGSDAVLAAAMTMFFSSGHAVPADGDVRRTLQRLGLAEEGEDVGQLQSFLERAVNKEEGAEAWALLHRLAETVCMPGEPQCEKCPVNGACRHGQHKLAAARQKKKSAGGGSGGRGSARGKGAARATAKSASSSAKSAKSRTVKSTAAKAKKAAAKSSGGRKSGAKAKPAAKTTVAARKDAAKVKTSGVKKKTAAKAKVKAKAKSSKSAASSGRGASSKAGGGAKKPAKKSAKKPAKKSVRKSSR